MQLWIWLFDIWPEVRSSDISLSRFIDLISGFIGDAFTCLKGQDKLPFLLSSYSLAYLI